MECPSSLRPIIQLCVGLLLVPFSLWQLCDVKHCADAQVELSQNSPQLGDKVELHDLAQHRVVSGCMGLKLEVGEETVRQRRMTLAVSSIYFWKKNKLLPYPLVTDLQHFGEEEQQ